MRDRRAITIFVLTLTVATGLAYITLELFLASVPRKDATRALRRLDEVGDRIPLFRSLFTREADESADWALATGITLIAVVSGFSLVAHYRRTIFFSLNAVVARRFPRLVRFRTPSPIRPPRDATVADILALAYEQRSLRACFVLLAALFVSLMLWRFEPSSTPSGIVTPMTVCVFYLALYARQALLHKRVRSGWFANNPHEVRQFVEFILSRDDSDGITRGGMRLTRPETALPASNLDGETVDA